MVTMTSILTPSFHVYYSKQLNQLPHSIKIDVWRRLTSRKHPLSIEQASSIHPEVEDLLNKAVENYIKQKEHQKMKPITIHANKYKYSGRNPGYMLFFDNFFDPSSLASRGTIYTNPILQQPNNYTYYPFHVVSK